jgi:hypothetical protein
MDSGLAASRRPGMTMGDNPPKQHPGIAAGVLHFVDRPARQGDTLVTSWLRRRWRQPCASSKGESSMMTCGVE